VDSGLWAEILGRPALKPKGQLRFVDSPFAKIHQSCQGAIGEFKNQAMGSTKAGTTQSSPRPLMNADTSWPSSASPVSALRRQQPNNYCRFWPKPWSSSGTRASTRTNEVPVISEFLSHNNLFVIPVDFIDPADASQPSILLPERFLTQSHVIARLEKAQ